jgi:hypothetical protein
MTRAARVVGALNWKYALGELVLIIAGVLIALATSAWWERREKASRAHVYVGELARDLNATIVQLDTAVAVDSFSISNSGAMLRFLHSNVPELPPQDSIRSWSTFRYPRFELTNGTIDRLLQTGDLNILPDTLRGLIADYASTIRNYQQQLTLIEQEFHVQTNLARERLEAHSTWRGTWQPGTQNARTFDGAAMRRDHMLRASYENARLMQRTHITLARQSSAKAVALRANVKRILVERD